MDDVTQMTSSDKKLLTVIIILSVIMVVGMICLLLRLRGT